MLERYFIPLAPHLLLAAVCIVGLFLAFSFEKEYQRLKRRAGPRQSDDAATRELKVQIHELSDRLRDAEQIAGVSIPLPAPKASLNLNKRTQVLRMSRRGERPESIAASLSLPRREVELLLKIHGLVLKAPQDPGLRNEPL